MSGSVFSFMAVGHFCHLMYGFILGSVFALVLRQKLVELG
jgi:hypothetical protein